MKIKTIEELQQVLDSDFSWRFKELSILKTNVGIGGSVAEKANIRTAIVMLYAHWEGSIKSICEAYLIFVSTRKLKYKELSTCFLAIIMKDKLSKCELTIKATVHNQAIDFILGSMEDRANIPKRDIIKTHSNLNSEVFVDILSTIGIDFSPYALKFNQIDSNLVSLRNTVAHGQYVNLQLPDFETLYADIIGIMSGVKSDIENAASLKSYKR